MYLQTILSDSEITWEISRPERGNALGPSLANEIKDSLDKLESNLISNKKIRALVIKAKTEAKSDTCPVWIGGGDLVELYNLKTKDEGENYARNLALICQRLESLPIPILICIDGLVIGGGIEFVFSGDVIIATKRSQFKFKQLSIGLCSGYASTKRLINALGQKAFSTLLFNDTITSQKALDYGFVYKLVDNQDDMDLKTQQLLAKINKLSFDSVCSQKKMFNTYKKINHSQFETELDLFKSLWMEEKHKKSLDKFMTNKTK